MDIPTEAEIRDALIARIKKYSDERGKSYSEIGLAAIGDRNLVFDLFDGRSLRISTYHRVIAYLDGKPKLKRPARLLLMPYAGQEQKKPRRRKANGTRSK